MWRKDLLSFLHQVLNFYIDTVAEHWKMCMFVIVRTLTTYTDSAIKKKKKTIHTIQDLEDIRKGVIQVWQ